MDDENETEVEMVDGVKVDGPLEILDDSNADSNFEVDFAASLLVRKYAESGAPEFNASCPSVLSQQVILRSSVFRGQKLPSEHMVRRTCEALTSNKHTN